MTDLSLSASTMTGSAPSTSAANYAVTEFHSGLWRTVSSSVIEHTEQADANMVSRVLADALAHDKLWHDVLGKHASRKRVIELMRGEVLHAISHAPENAFVHSSCDRRCVAVWRRRRGLHGSGRMRIFRYMMKKWPLNETLHAMHVLHVLERTQPNAPHMHLQMFGSMNKASANLVLGEMTARLDREGTPAYVVASGDGDVRLFESHGFKTLYNSFKGLRNNSLSLVGMWRTPKDAIVSNEFPNANKSSSFVFRITRAFSML